MCAPVINSITIVIYNTNALNSNIKLHCNAREFIFELGRIN